MANCGCPPGFILNQNGECVGTSDVPVTVNQTVYTACKGDTRIGIMPATFNPPYTASTYPLQVYGLTGATFYEDISAKPFPIIALPVPIPCSLAPVYPAFCPVWNFYQVTPLQDNLGNPILVTNTIQNDVWGKTTGCDLTNSPNFRLNKVGIWTCLPPVNFQAQPINEWIGFTFCEQILYTKTYYIGIAADDSYKLYVNGTLVVDHSGTGFAFTSWKIIPITLNAGPVIFEARVINTSSVATLGFEIYNATLPQLLGITQDVAAGPANDINTYIIFSTKDKIGQTWQTGENSGYTCPDGYSLNTCDGLVCSQVTVVPPSLCCFLLQSCDGSIADILVDNDLSAFLDTVIEICPENIPSGGGSGTGSGLPIEIINNTNTLWDLHDCCGLLPPMRVDSYLGAYNGGIIVIPSVSLTTCWRVEKSILNIPFVSPDLTGGTYYRDCPTCQAEFPCEPPVTLTECKCFTVVQAQGCVGTITLLNPQIITNFPTCDLCEPKCYYLVDCTDAANFILTNNQVLAQYVGQVIKLEDCPNTCWQVLLSDTCDNSTCIQDVIAVFEDCKTCLPPLLEIPAKSLRPRAVKPGYYTPGCSPEYTEKVSCSFATQIYNIMLIKRYGLTICCEEDQINWQIKKQLLDFKALYDPELCKCFINSCCPPTCVEVELNVFNPTICPPPTNVVPLLSMPCLPPTNVIPLLEYPVLVRCIPPSSVQGVIRIV